jgi:hypothetical protein
VYLKTWQGAGILAISLAIWLAPLTVHAQSPEPYPDFTFKREKPPKPGQKRLITVQIEDQPQADDPTGPTPGAETDLALGAYGWFWSRVSPSLGENPGLRLASAFENLSDGPGGARVSGPRLQTLQEIAQGSGAHILRATIGTRVSPALVLAVIAVESGGTPTAQSHKGAQGLMQLMPDTAARFGVTDAFSVEQNIKGGVAYLDWLMKEFEGDAVLALAGYNAGEGAVRKHAGVPPFAETRDYVPKVLAAFDVARGLCKTRPELITDACALNLAAN